MHRPCLVHLRSAAGDGVVAFRAGFVECPSAFRFFGNGFQCRVIFCHGRYESVVSAVYYVESAVLTFLKLPFRSPCCVCLCVEVAAVASRSGVVAVAQRRAELIPIGVVLVAKCRCRILVVFWGIECFVWRVGQSFHGVVAFGVGNDESELPLVAFCASAVGMRQLHEHLVPSLVQVQTHGVACCEVLVFESFYGVILRNVAVGLFPFWCRNLLVVEPDARPAAVPLSCFWRIFAAGAAVGVELYLCSHLLFYG